MTDYTFDPDNWLVSTGRVLQSYTGDQLREVLGLTTDDLVVEMSFPDTRSWTKELPLSKIFVHFERDHTEPRMLGFGTPGAYVENEIDNTVELWEAEMYELNYDVGIWCSAEMGGPSKRAEVFQALLNMFTLPASKQAFAEATGGLYPISLRGGRDELDRVNDIPIWRVLDLTLIVRVFSRRKPSAPIPIADKFDQVQDLTIVGDDLTLDPI